MKWPTLLIVLSLFLYGLSSASAQKIDPVQKTTTTSTPTQKSPVPTASTPTQKTTVFEGPTQKTTVTNVPTQKDIVVPQSSPVQKTTTFNGPIQKGSYGTANSTPIEIPNDLLDRLRRNEPQECQPLRNLARAIARKCIKARIGEIVRDKLPTPPGNGPLPLP